RSARCDGRSRRRASPAPPDRARRRSRRTRRGAYGGAPSRKNSARTRAWCRRRRAPSPAMISSRPSRMAAEQTIHLERYAPEAKALVAGAQSLADERKHAQVEPIHLLARAIDRDRGVAEVFKKAGAEPSDVAVEAEAQLARIPKTSGGLA